MTRFRILAVVCLPLLALGLAYALTGGMPEPSPNPPNTFSFAVLGDAPYYVWEEWQYRRVLASMDSYDLNSVIHVGDIFWKPCSDERYEKARRWLDGLRHPVIYTPGDNEWLDCWMEATGEYVPLERLNRVREIFFDEPRVSLGGERMPLNVQADDPDWSEFVENARWVHERVVFATLHLVGDPSLQQEIPGRGPADVEERVRRLEAATAWMKESFAVADSLGAPAVVLAFHANPAFEDPFDSEWRQDFEPFLTHLEMEVERFRRPVLAVHGDMHDYIVDRPLVRRSTGEGLRNFVRMQVPGSPQVGWVQVLVSLDQEQPFWFQAHVVPRWKYW